VADPVKPPELLPTTPKELRAFVDCTADKVTIKNGAQAWLKGGEIEITPGETPTTGTLAAGKGFLKFHFPVSVANGQLTFDMTDSYAPKEIQDGLTTFANDLNAWFKHKGRQLGPVTFGPDGTTLTKVLVAAAQPGQSVPAPVPTAQPPAPKPEPVVPKPEPKPEPPAEPYYEPKYVTQPPLPDKELFPPKDGPSVAPVAASGAGSSSVGPPFVGAGGPGGPKSPAGLSGVAIRYIVAVIIAAVLLGGGFIVLGGGGSVPAAASLPPTASPRPAASSVPSQAAKTPAPSTAPSTAASTPATGGLIFAPFEITKDVKVDSCHHDYTVVFTIKDSAGQSAAYAAQTAVFVLLDNEPDRIAAVGADGTFSASVKEAFQKTGSGCFSHLQPKVKTVGGKAVFG
jgi:hypothetical protein